ncbi:MAG: hypothetical protein ACRDZW_03150, partial [Acidimicrobiales bacterium]
VTPEAPAAPAVRPAAPVVKKAPPTVPVPRADQEPSEAGEAPESDAAAGTRTSRTAGRRRRPRSDESWVEPTGSACPPSHPVKAKLKSMLFHLPGMAAYARTTPDRCYLDATSAESDGFTRAKR